MLHKLCFSLNKLKKYHKSISTGDDVRKFLNPKIWSQGTNIGGLRALGATLVVLGFSRVAISFISGMVYIIMESISLGYFFAIARPSVDMWVISGRPNPGSCLPRAKATSWLVVFISWRHFMQAAPMEGVTRSTDRSSFFCCAFLLPVWLEHNLCDAQSTGL